MLTSRFGFVEDRPLQIRYIAHALLTKREYFPPTNTFVGAVYDRNGILQRDTLRYNVADIEPTDPSYLDAATRDAQIIDTAVYGGILHPVLGHTIFETLARFWLSTVCGVSHHSSIETVYIFHHWPGLSKSQVFENSLIGSFFSTAGINERNVRIITDRDVIVNHLFVPDRASIYHEYMHPIFNTMLDRFRDGVPKNHTKSQPPHRIFFSRSLWGHNKRFSVPDKLDDLFVSLGFRIVFPETLEPDELMGCLQQANTVAAVDGSAPHLFGFCRPGTNVIMLDTRHVPTQVAVEKLRSLNALHIPLLEMRDIMNEASEIINYPALKSLVWDIIDILEGRIL